MEEREKIIRLWFDMWLCQEDLGISLIEWTSNNKIKSLKEFGCNLNNYNPYQNSDIPQFKAEKVNWF